MDNHQEPRPKAVDSQKELRPNWWLTFRLGLPTAITFTGLVLSLPFAISASLMIVGSMVIEVGNIDLQIAAAANSPWAYLATLLQWSTFCFFFPALPGAILAITGFVMRRTRLASIALLVAAAPWFLFALLYLVLYLFFPNLLV